VTLSTRKLTGRLPSSVTGGTESKFRVTSDLAVFS